MHEAIGLIELNSVARGFLVCDAMAKKAPIEILEASPICPGKFIVLIAGKVAPVEESLTVGRETGKENIIDELFLPHIHKQVIPSFSCSNSVKILDALGIIETLSVASTIVAADIAAKATNITLIESRLAKGLGGKAYVTLTGTIADVEASVEAGKNHAAKLGFLVNTTVIPAPHSTLSRWVF